MTDDLLGRLRGAASAIALCPQMETRHGETCDLAYERIDALKAALRELIDTARIYPAFVGERFPAAVERARALLAAPEDAP